MSKYYLVLIVLIASSTGCGSFRTSALYRHANDSVSAQETNQKLKGLPVKLKVPSHIQITVHEQQVILVNTDSQITNAENERDAAAAMVVEQSATVAGLDNAVSTAKTAFDNASREVAQALQAVEKLNMEIQELGIAIANLNNQLEPDNVPERAMLESKLKSNELALKNKMAQVDSTKQRLDLAQTRIGAANQALIDANAALSGKPAAEAKLQELMAKAEVATKKAVRRYSLISFSPAQYEVETELQYTDKVFLVDFKRPIGGVLNLQEASLDDEQYFSKIQAEVQERTLSDVGTALSTIQSPLSALLNPNAATEAAIPTSADTPAGEGNETVDFQKSVIATKRFDISEQGWEERMHAFVNQYLHTNKVVSPSLPLEYTQPLMHQIAPTGEY